MMRLLSDHSISICIEMEESVRGLDIAIFSCYYI